MEEILIGAVEIPEFTEPSAGYHGLYIMKRWKCRFY
jgi:hypothetical protein